MTAFWLGFAAGLPSGVALGVLWAVFSRWRDRQPRRHECLTCFGYGRVFGRACTRCRG